MRAAVLHGPDDLRVEEVRRAGRRGAGRGARGHRVRHRSQDAAPRPSDPGRLPGALRPRDRRRARRHRRARASWATRWPAAPAARAAPGARRSAARRPGCWAASPSASRRRRRPARDPRRPGLRRARRWPSRWPPACTPWRAAPTRPTSPCSAAGRSGSCSRGCSCSTAATCSSATAIPSAARRRRPSARGRRTRSASTTSSSRRSGASRRGSRRWPPRAPAAPRSSSAAARAGRPCALATGPLHYDEVDVRGAFHHTRAEIDRALALLAAGDGRLARARGGRRRPRGPGGRAAGADRRRGAQARGGSVAMRRALAPSRCCALARGARRARGLPARARSARRPTAPASARADRRLRPRRGARLAGDQDRRRRPQRRRAGRCATRSPPPCPRIVCAPPWRGCARCAPGARAAPATRRRSCGWPARCTATSPAGGDADLRLLRDLAGLLPRPAAAPRRRRRAPRSEPRRARHAHARQLQRLRPQPRLAGAHAARDRRPACAALLAMPPLAYADQHEQGGAGFFAPPYSAPLFHELPEAALAAERDVVGPAVRAAFAAQGLPVEQRRDLRPALPRLRRQRHDAALRRGRDDVRVGRREPVRAARRRAPRGRPRRACARSPATARRC